MAQLFLLISFAACVYGDLNPTEISAIREYMKEEVYSESSAEAFVRRWGPDVVPVLQEIVLSKDSTLEEKTKACFHLGKTGDPSTFATILGFLESGILDDVGARERSAWNLTCASLGFLGSEQACSYLRLFASSQYWTDRLASGEERFKLKGSGTMADVVMLLRISAVYGLATSKTECGTRALIELSKEPDGLSIEVLQRAAAFNQDRRSDNRSGDNTSQ